VYVPREFLGASDGDPSRIFEREAPHVSERLVLDRLVQKAERHLSSAGDYLEHIPRRRHGIRLFCMLPYLFAVRTLALSRGNARVFRHEVKITRDEVDRISRSAKLLGWSNGWIRWYAGRLMA
jgi:farnesyl-diphosphate farnesyltransferase